MERILQMRGRQTLSQLNAAFCREQRWKELMAPAPLGGIEIPRSHFELPLRGAKRRSAVYRSRGRALSERHGASLAIPHCTNTLLDSVWRWRAGRTMLAQTSIRRSCAITRAAKSTATPRRPPILERIVKRPCALEYHFAVEASPSPRLCFHAPSPGPEQTAHRKERGRSRCSPCQ